MSLKTIGKLERVHLREVWKHEALDFTQWLEENIDTLNTALGLNLINVDREQAAGDFSVDLVAEDENGATVIIENQLEKSNHDHLGKLITYLTAMSAKAAIWIVSDPRPEHVAAITWLNEASAVDFYMVKVEAVKIGDSPAAPLFTLIVGPSEEAKTVGIAKKEIAERYHIRKRWWTTLIERSSAITKLHAHITPGVASWIGVSTGLRGVNFNYAVWQDECGAEVYIDRGKDCEEENESIYDQLLANKDAIEKAFGGPLLWERLDSRRACRISYICKEGGYRSPEDQWEIIQDSVVHAMDRLEKAIKPFLSNVKLGN
jgi:hypothetical protein